METINKVSEISIDQMTAQLPHYPLDTPTGSNIGHKNIVINADENMAEDYKVMYV